MKKEICYYVTENSKVPVEEYLWTLRIQKPKLYTKVLVKIELLSKNNWMCDGDVKHFDGKIFELRIKHSSNISRVFFYTFERDKIILFSGYTKKTNKTPQSEILLLNKYYNDFNINKRYT